MIKSLKGSGESLNGFLDHGTEIFGELRFRNAFRIDGRVRGKIFSDNDLIIGETGHVEADIDCGEVSVRGQVAGRIQARKKIELLAGSRVEGSLVSPKVVIEDGASFQGDCDMPSSQTQAQKESAGAPGDA